MSIKEQLMQIIDDPAMIEAVMKITESKLTPQQKYIRSDKGKAAKQRSNAKCAAAKPKTVDDQAAKEYLVHWHKKAVEELEVQDVYHESLNELWTVYKRYKNYRDTVKMLEFKAQLELLQVPTVNSYIGDITGVRIQGKVYKLDVVHIGTLLN